MTHAATGRHAGRGRNADGGPQGSQIAWKSLFIVLSAKLPAAVHCLFSL